MIIILLLVHMLLQQYKISNLIIEILLMFHLIILILKVFKKIVIYTNLCKIRKHYYELEIT
jgi:hypothetical protein